MFKLKRALFGYELNTIDWYLKNFRRFSELDLIELKDRIQSAQIKLNNLQEEAEYFLEMETQAHDEISAALELEMISDSSYFEETKEFFAEPEFTEEAKAEETTYIEEKLTYFEETANLKPISVVPTRQVEDSMGKVLMFRRKKDMDSDYSDDLLQAEVQAERRRETKINTGFWNSIEHYLEVSDSSVEVNIDTDLAMSVASVESEQLNGTSHSGNYSSYFNYSLPEKPAFRNHTASPRKPTLAESKQMKRKLESDLPKNQRNEPVQASQEISREVRQLRYQYITGKYAGEDHYDRSNKLIVKKDHQLTEEIIDRANQAGKLAELIIHMYIPGLGEET